MFIEFSDLFWFTLICLCLWYWWSAQQVREIALNAARKRCKEMSLQLLDESVSLRALWLKRDDNGQLRVWRRYIFEFSSTGEDRYQGKVIMLSLRITHVELEPHRLNE
ncbi:MAG: DUF3301 domain-containing protein [Pseudomonadales bacterium]|jgi:hypothetical protein